MLVFNMGNFFLLNLTFLMLMESQMKFLLCIISDSRNV